jgi:hypothetical protein
MNASSSTLLQVLVWIHGVGVNLNLYPSHPFYVPFFSLIETFQYPLILNATPVNFTADEEKLNLRRFSAFVDFLHTGDPNLGPMNASVETTWKKYDPVKRNMIYLSEPEVFVPNAEYVPASQCNPGMWFLIEYHQMRNRKLN